MREQPDSLSCDRALAAFFLLIFCFSVSHRAAILRSSPQYEGRHCTTSVPSRKVVKKVFLVRAGFPKPRQGRQGVAQCASPGLHGPHPVRQLTDAPLPLGRERGRGEGAVCRPSADGLISSRNTWLRTPVGGAIATRKGSMHRGWKIGGAESGKENQSAILYEKLAYQTGLLVPVKHT